MINLEKKVVLVRFNTDYPENSPKRWRVLVGEITTDEDLKVLKMEEGETYLVDHINSVCQVSTWSGVTPNGMFTHNLIFQGQHFKVRKTENDELVAIVGKIVEEPIEETKPINPETELDAE